MTPTRPAPLRAALTALALVGVATAGAGCSTPAPAGFADGPTGTPTVSEIPVHRCLADDVVPTLSVRQKAAQLLTVGVRSVDDARWALVDQGVGGVFVGSDAAAALLPEDRLTGVVRQAPLPALVSIDEEGGRVSRLAVLTGPLPAPRRMASTMSPEEVRGLAAERGARLRSFGVTVDFAPSLDVSTQPDSAVIGDRSFSGDPATVTRYARAFAQGLLDSGVTPVFKHFPGHGRSTGDSHRGPVQVPDYRALQQSDLRPFADLAAMPGVAVMVGHLEAPGLTEPGRPATLSGPAYDALRSGSYGGPPYPGTIFTDDLSGMRAITDRLPLPEAVLASLIAGADSPLWISTEGLPAVLDRIEQAVADGSYSPQRLDASLRRMLVLRAPAGCLH